MSDKKKGYPLHPYCEVFPPLQGQALYDLRDDIAANGLAESIVLYQGRVLDGRNRQTACVMKGVEPRYEEFAGDDHAALAFVVSKNLKRRHLGETDRALIAARVANLQRGRPRSTEKGPSENGGPASSEGESTSELIVPSGTINSADAAEMLNVSVRAVRRATKVQKEGTAALQKAVSDGTVSLSDAAKVAGQPATVQNEAIKAVKSGKAKTATQAVQAETNGTPPAEPKELKDAEGHSVPPSCEDHFKTVAKFEELDSLCRQLQKGMDEISRLPGGEQLRMYLTPTGPEGKTINKSDHLNLLITNLKTTRPHSVCPYCKGKGPKECKGCSGRCWVSKPTWKDIEDKVKEKLAC